MDKTYKYHVDASWTRHYRGLIKPGDAIPYTLEFSVPPEFGGEGRMWTPEHLLLSALASCFVASFRGMAEKSKLQFDTIEVDAEGVIEAAEGRFTKITLHPMVLIAREEDRQRTARLLEKTQHGCLIGRSLSSTLEMTPQIRVGAPMLT